MIINTENLTVIFSEGEVLTFERLGDVLDALERIQRNQLPDWELDLLRETPLERDKRRNKEALAALEAKFEKDKVTVLYEIVVPSDSDLYKVYRIKGFRDGHLECTCPDFEHRGHTKDGLLVPGYECKHIRRFLYRTYG